MTNMERKTFCAALSRYGAQAVDAVPVVRCQNCKYYALWADGRSMNYCDKHECTMYDEDFCSYGERRAKP